MIEIYLKFPNQVTAVAMAQQFGLYAVDSHGGQRLVSASHKMAIDVVGTVYAPTGGTVTHNGMTSPEMAPVDGWFINIAVLDPAYPIPHEALAPFTITPGPTHRGWAA